MDGFLDHVDQQVMWVMGTINEGGEVYAPPRRRGSGPTIITKYHVDDGYHAAQVCTGDFDPLYRLGSYVIFVTGTVRDAVVSGPALLKTIGDGGWFGFVDRVTPDTIHLRPVRPGLPAQTIRRDSVEMVYIPVDRIAGKAMIGQNVWPLSSIAS